MKSWKWLSIALVLVVMVGTSECAEKFPAGPITYIIPFNPGGQSDVEARLQQPHLEKLLGVPIVVNYVPGAGGGLAWTKFAKTKGDGYSVCGINIPHIILQPLAQADIAFKTADLKPLCMFESTPIGLAMKEGSTITSLKQFVEFAKANPGKITVGISGKLSGHHLAALQFMKLTDTKLTLVTFTGAGPQMTSLLGGHVEAVFGNSSDLVTFKNQIKVLAIGSDKRMSVLPDVPTFIEEGLKFTPRIDRGVAVPKDTSPEIASALEQAFLKTVNLPEYRAKVEAAGFIPLGLNAEQSAKFLAWQTALCEQLLGEHNLLLKK